MQHVVVVQPARHARAAASATPRPRRPWPARPLSGRRYRDTNVRDGALLGRLTSTSCMNFASRVRARASRVRQGPRSRIASRLPGSRPLLRRARRRTRRQSRRPSCREPAACRRGSTCRRSRQRCSSARSRGSGGEAQDEPDGTDRHRAVQRAASVTVGAHRSDLAERDANRGSSLGDGQPAWLMAHYRRGPVDGIDGLNGGRRLPAACIGVRLRREILDGARRGRFPRRPESRRRGAAHERHGDHRQRDGAAPRRSEEGMRSHRDQGASMT